MRAFRNVEVTIMAITPTSVLVDINGDELWIGKGDVGDSSSICPGMRTDLSIAEDWLIQKSIIDAG